MGTSVNAVEASEVDAGGRVVVVDADVVSTVSLGLSVVSEKMSILSGAAVVFVVVSVDVVVIVVVARVSISFDCSSDTVVVAVGADETGTEVAVKICSSTFCNNKIRKL